MKRFALMTAAALLVMLPGCKTEQTFSHDRAVMNAWSVDVYHTEMIHRAILTEHTLYPHHFVKHSAALNDLGERDIDVLTRHYADNPGPLNVRRGRAGDDLYEARLKTVVEYMRAGGVDLERVALADGFAGGDGMSAEQVLRNRARQGQRPDSYENK